MRIVGLALLAATVAACSDQDVPRPAPLEGLTTIAMDFSGKGGFYGSPFPSDARMLGGRVDVSGFPNPDANDLVARVMAILEHDADGFGVTSGIFFRISGPLREGALPDLHASVQPGSSVALIAVGDDSPGARVPVSARFLANGGPFGDANLLVLLPLQGAPLRPRTRYAAIVMRDLEDLEGRTLGVSPQMSALVSGGRPEGMDDAALSSYRAALQSLEGAGVDTGRLAGIAVFTTGAPAEAMGVATSALLEMPLPAPSAPFARTDLFDDYCVYATTIGMPELQEGEPPYSDTGGGWVLDASGTPVVQRTEEARFVVTIPRRPMPAAGYPIVLFSRTGGGGERPLVDRGTQAVADGPASSPGTGPALFFARAGFAGASVDGPHGGLRNVTHGDEQFLMFNVGNPVALRDNVRQSAAELALQAHVLEQVVVDVSDCPGATSSDGVARFDVGTMALMGHSMGATIAPLTLAFEPRFRAGLLSGAGGSWIENVVYKQKPVAVKGIAEVLIGIAGSGYELSEHDPLLSMFQWAGEPADPPVYADRIVRTPVDGAPRHILMMQGIVDHYILPSIANATSLSLGLDLAGDALDAETPEVASFAPLESELDLVGHTTLDLPASGNVIAPSGTKTTAIVVMHREDGIEDGHEVVFQTEAPKREYRCFLEGLAKGMPVVVAGDSSTGPCE